MTKDEIRQKVRTRLKLAGVAGFPGVEACTPNFVGAARAAQLLCDLPMWKRAKVVLMTADAPQLPIRRAALHHGKIVYLSIPKLRGERCFVELDPEKLGSKLRRAASIKAAMQLGRLLAPHEMRPVDLIVCGSVAVNRQGARLGRGGGYWDLAYALLRTEGKIREYTPILTTVHPLQIIDDRLPMRGHDIPVDFLITPDQVIAAPSLHPRPRGVIWEILREDKILSIPLLRKGRRDARGVAPRHV
ncbi:MAG TPA: 5-formyltetrahydrofolate cyclo-ligase [Candidatus Acidoferrales bacterium]|nr:5-formyltetrahydrofolate cyclo-ligase [Candidatus Acidoferrales bacterium]